VQTAAELVAAAALKVTGHGGAMLRENVAYPRSEICFRVKRKKWQYLY